MSAPPELGFPVLRQVGYLSNARWDGPDERLWLRVDYPARGGLTATINLRAFAWGSDKQQVCIPTGRQLIDDLPREALVAPLAMYSILAGLVPCTQEFTDAVVSDPPGSGKIFRTAIGDVDVSSVAGDERFADVTFRRVSDLTTRMIAVDVATLDRSGYRYYPATQLHVLAGSIAAQYPACHHDALDGVVSSALTQAERDDIAGYVDGLTVWV